MISPPTPCSNTGQLIDELAQERRKMQDHRLNKDYLIKQWDSAKELKDIILAIVPILDSIELLCSCQLLINQIDQYMANVDPNRKPVSITPDLQSALFPPESTPPPP